jgi:hypothetical protein
VFNLVKKIPIIVIMIGILVFTGIGCCCSCPCPCPCAYPCTTPTPNSTVTVTVTTTLPPPQECQCGKWKQSIISWNGCESHQSEQVDCGTIIKIEQLFLGTVITVDSSYYCVGPNCQPPSYNWSVTSSNGPVQANGYLSADGTTLSVNFSPTTPDTYTVVLYASCNGIKCDPCTLTIYIDNILPKG